MRRISKFHKALVNCYCESRVRNKGAPRQAEVAQGVPGRIRPPDFLDISALRGWEVVSQNEPATFTPGEIPGTHFQRLSQPQCTFCRGYHGKKSPVTASGIDSGTVRLVAQRLNQYATPGPPNYE